KVLEDLGYNVPESELRTFINQLAIDKSDLLDEWSHMTPKLKELLSNTRKIPLHTPELTTNNIEFRRLKQLLNDMEMTISSWTNAINQCRYVLQHAQKQFHRS
ncbi:unnamed protein product, partial [Rotaria sordida]